MAKIYGTDDNYLDSSVIYHNDTSLDKILNQGIIHVSGLNLSAGESLTDERIKDAKMIVIYFTLLDYRQSMVIQKNFSSWHVGSLDNPIFYIKVNWIDGRIEVSSNTSSIGKLLGYDIIL